MTPFRPDWVRFLESVGVHIPADVDDLVGPVLADAMRRYPVIRVICPCCHRDLSPEVIETRNHPTCCVPGRLPPLTIRIIQAPGGET